MKGAGRRWVLGVAAAVYLDGAVIQVRSFLEDELGNECALMSDLRGKRFSFGKLDMLYVGRLITGLTLEG